MTELGGATQKCEFDEGHYLNPGPWRIPYHHNGLLDYCKRLGVTLEPFQQLNHNAFLHSKDAFGGKPQRVRPHQDRSSGTYIGTAGQGHPIAQAVEIPAGKTTVYLSGAIPSVVDEQADRSSVAAFGDTITQTVSVLESIEKTLERLDLTMGDVVKMQVFLVGDPENGGRMDFDGFMEGYTQFFGTEEQPNLPSRSVVQVAGLANPGFLVEIEVTAVRP